MDICLQGYKILLFHFVFRQENLYKSNIHDLKHLDKFRCFSKKHDICRRKMPAGIGTKFKQKIFKI